MEISLKELNQIHLLEKPYNKNIVVKNTQNKLYLETNLQAIELYTKHKQVQYNESKQDNVGRFYPAGTILQSWVRPYQNNFLQLQDNDILVSNAYHAFYNENQQINDIVFLFLNTTIYQQFIKNNIDETGQKPEISLEDWSKLVFSVKADIELENFIKSKRNAIKKNIQNEKIINTIYLINQSINQSLNNIDFQR